jgi:hypothetical protein
VDVVRLQEIFPKTLELLNECNSLHLKDQFGITATRDLLILSDRDQSRWFPVFLKLQGTRQQILEVAEFEYLKHTVKNLDLGEPTSEDGIIKLNPTVQFVELHHDQPKLGRLSGLYCFFKKTSDFFEFQLGIQQALILDFLQQERKYNLRQLIEMAKQHQLGARHTEQQWREIIEEMISIGLLLTPSEA